MGNIFEIIQEENPEILDVIKEKANCFQQAFSTCENELREQLTGKILTQIESVEEALGKQLRSTKSIIRRLISEVVTENTRDVYSSYSYLVANSEQIHGEIEPADKPDA